MTTNYSLWSVPAYQMLTLAAYTYATAYLEKAAPNVNWDKVNHRNSANRIAFEKAVPREVFLKYERCTSAHINMNEGMAFFIGAVLAGIMTKLDPKFMNNATGFYLLTRLAYVFVYTSFGRKPLGYLRPVVWWGGTITIFTIYYKAAMMHMNS